MAQKTLYACEIPWGRNGNYDKESMRRVWGRDRLPGHTAKDLTEAVLKKVGLVGWMSSNPQ